MDIMELLEGRRSIRKFQQDKPVPQEVVDKILEAGRIASSAANKQPLKFIVVQSSELVEQVFPLIKWAARLPEDQGVPKDGEHPVLYVVTLTDRSIKTNYAATDAGLALSNMTLAAWSEGVGSCILGSVDRATLRSLLEISTGLQIHSVTAYGYPAISSHVVEAKDGDIGYYLDDDGNYCVPKRPLSETVTVL